MKILGVRELAPALADNRTAPPRGADAPVRLSGQTHRPHAFTLLELLVVISIIGILAAISGGFLASARKSGEAAQCVNNLKQLAAANLAYAAENGTYSPAQDSENFVRWHGSRGSHFDEFTSSGGYLTPYFGEEGRVKACPTFRELLGAEEGSFEIGSGGYGYNAAYIGGQPGKMLQPAVPASVPIPPRTLMFADTALARSEGVQEYPFAEPYRASNAMGTALAGKLAPSVHFRHQGRAHVAWCDGSVSAEIPAKLGSGKNIYGGDSAKHQLGWIGPEAFNGVWNPNYEAEAEAAAALP